MANILKLFINLLYETQIVGSYFGSIERDNGGAWNALFFSKAESYGIGARILIEMRNIYSMSCEIILAEGPAFIISCYTYICGPGSKPCQCYYGIGGVSASLPHVVK